MAGTNAWRKFLLLLSKNWKLQVRRPIVTFFEILLPTLFCLILLAVRTSVSSSVVTTATQFPSYSVSGFSDSLMQTFTLPKLGLCYMTVAYAPNTSLTQRIVGDALDRIHSSTHYGPAAIFMLKSQGFDTEDAMVDFLTSNRGSKDSLTSLGGIVFTNIGDGNNATSLRNDISFKIRLSGVPRLESAGAQFQQESTWGTGLLFPQFLAPGPRDGNNSYNPKPAYYEEGFLTLQNALTLAIIAELNPDVRSLPAYAQLDVRMQRFPFPPYIDDLFLSVLQTQLPFIVMLSLIFIALNIPKEVVQEKEHKLKEAMKMMGMNNWLHWVAWFTKYFMFLLIAVGIMTLILCLPGVSSDSHFHILKYSASSVVFVFLLLYAVSTICFSFMISVFFDRANAAAAAGGIFFFLSYIPYLIINPRYYLLGQSTKIATSLLSNNAMALGAFLIGLHEGTGEGAQWSNLSSPVSVDDQLTLLQIFGMLLLDSVLYLIIAWYGEAVFPGSYGIPQPWYFFVLPTYWCGSRKAMSSTAARRLSNADEFFEDEPVGIKAGIQIHGLTKMYKGNNVKRPAVNDLSLNFYEGQITALLGHNGAGKTTTMFMLTGFLPPTAGSALVNGYDIHEDIAGVRSSLGLCPQHDILFDNLTVEEHLLFFAKLKGCPADKCQEQVSYYVDVLGLIEKRTSFAKTLSGGQKRRLSVGIALIGDSKVVILDEPTSGMDPSARRHMWDVLQKHREGRTIVLSTHFMDEADSLGNRIAIMAEGTVRCCGSSLFLKNKFGAGYHLTMVKQAGCVVENVKAVITQHVPDARLESSVGAELSFVLPHAAVASFAKLFDVLESQKDKLGIMSYGASVTTMEEVFLKVGEGTSEAISEKVQERLHADRRPSDSSELKNIAANSDHYVAGNGAEQLVRTNSEGSVNHDDVKKNAGFILQLQQFYAMFVKRVVYTLRNRVLTLSQILLPALFTIVTAIVMKTLPNNTVQPPLEVSVIDKYGRTTVYYDNLNGTSNVTTGLATTYSRAFTSSQNVHQVPDAQAAILALGANSIGEYTFKEIVAASFGVANVTTGAIAATALFNAQSYHGAAASLSFVGQALLTYFVNVSSSSASYSISVTNHPLPQTVEAQAQAAATQFNAQSFSYSSNLAFGMSFLASSFVVFLIGERAAKVKHSQFVSGVTWYNFWMSTLAWDIINYLLPSLLLLLIFKAFDVTELSTGPQLGRLLVVLIAFGLALLPNMYVLQYLFTGVASGYVALTFYNILTGITPGLVVVILDLIGDNQTSDVLRWIFYVLFPNYNFSESITNLFQNYEFLDLCTNQIPSAFNTTLDTICSKLLPALNRTLPCCKDYPDVCGSNCLNFQENYFALEPLGLGRPVLFLVGQCLVFWFLLFIIESGVVRSLQYKCRPKRYVTPKSDTEDRLDEHAPEDSDVTTERLRLQQGSPSELGAANPVVIAGLTKYFADRHAVDGLYLAVPAGECFGLLGVNGAGKTTTFRMLTGDETLSGGNAFLSGHSVRKDMAKIHRSIGYCPQFDALIDQMTGEETLFMYARLRGIPEKEIQRVAEDLLEAFILTPHAKKLVKEYSGGNKRKLSAAIALVGDPPIVFLDEPTTGMDPVARRMLWDTLSQVRDSGKTLILTSHSMEECEALCTRLAVMVNGQFKCLGSTQHLKNKFGLGYTLMARVGYRRQAESEDEALVAPDLKPLMQHIEQAFPGSVLKDVHQNLVHYHVNNPSLTWSALFSGMERAKHEFNIEDYSVSQTTLEQVFINFARSQVPPKDEDPSGASTGCLSRLRSTVCVCCIPEVVVADDRHTQF